MVSTVTSRLAGFNLGAAIKGPCYVATTGANITLSSTQVIDGIAVGSCQRVLVKDQTDATENGIYISDSSTWTRAKDCDGDRDLVPGSIVYVDRGADNAAKYWVFNSSSTALTVDVETDDITLSEITSQAAVIATGSTTSRSLADRFAEVYNVKDYGAAGNGTTDDSAAIQAAIDAAEAATYGGIVFFPPGEYLVTSTLTCTGPLVSFEGTGRRSSKLTINVSSGYGLSIDISAGGAMQSGHMRGLQFDGHASGTETGLVLVDYGLDWLVEDCIFQDAATGHNLTFGRGQNVTIMGCEIRNAAGDGLRFIQEVSGGSGSGQGMRIIGNTIKDNAGAGIRFPASGGNESFISGNTIETNGIDIDAVTGDHRIVGNSFENSGGNTGVRVGNGGGAQEIYIGFNLFEASSSQYIAIDLDNYVSAVIAFNKFGGGFEEIDIASGDGNKYSSFIGNTGIDRSRVTNNANPPSKIVWLYNNDTSTTAFNPTATDGDTTPSVFNTEVLHTANTSPTTITKFEDGRIGQSLMIVIGDDNTTISDDGSVADSVDTGTGGNITPADGDVLVLHAIVGSTAGADITWRLVAHIPATPTQAAAAGSFTVASASASAGTTDGWIEYKPGIWVPYSTDPAP